MSYCLDEKIERRGTDSRKWCEYPEDVLPFTGAELEFASPAPVISALCERINHPMFGYNIEPHELRRAIVSTQTSQELESLATREGMMEFRRAGLLKVAQGRTTMEEVLRTIPAELLGVE